MKIIYEQDDSTIATMAVAGQDLSMEQMVEFGIKFVPNGKVFKVVEDSDLPDPLFWEAWRVDFSEHDGIGEAL